MKVAKKKKQKKVSWRSQRKAAEKACSQYKDMHEEDKLCKRIQKISWRQE